MKRTTTQIETQSTMEIKTLNKNVLVKIFNSKGVGYIQNVLMTLSLIELRILMGEYVELAQTEIENKEQKEMLEEIALIISNLITHKILFDN